MSGFGLDEYGLGPYGSLDYVLVPSPPPPPGFGPPIEPLTGGYGGYPYGFGSYGSIGFDADVIVTSIRSIDGFRIEVFFSQEMTIDAALTDPASYDLRPLFGAADAEVLSVAIGIPGNLGPTSVILTHTGTTLCGRYEVVVEGPRSFSGNAVEWNAPFNRAEALCRGEPPKFTITPVSGNELLFQYDQPMLSESEFSPGIEDLNAYGFETDYPITIVPLQVTHPYLGDPSQALLEVAGMTSAQYQGVVSPSVAIQYTGDILPDQSEDFEAFELGNGTSIPSSQGLFLSKTSGDTYGWRFEDTTGRMQPNSSFRCDVTLNTQTIGFLSPSFQDGDFATILVSDGSIQTRFTLLRESGIDYIDVESNAYLQRSPAGWSKKRVTVSLVRNQRADTYGVVINGDPVQVAYTPTHNAPASIPAGVQVELSPLYTVTNLALERVSLTSTQTVFSAAWNFLHNQVFQFTGNNSFASGFILTNNGPLVKPWGDATPATPQNVVVKINGIPVDVAKVNPYIGKIYPTVPIPLFPPGTNTVTIDYIWIENPVMEFQGYNTEGLVYNKFDCPNPCPKVFSKGIFPYGANKPKNTRFKMGVVYGPYTLKQPKVVSARFMAFERAYTAAYNRPTTLQYNRSPIPVALPSEATENQGEVVFYEGDTDPTLASPAWQEVGDGFDDSLDLPEIETPGIWELDKFVQGPFGVGDVAFYERSAVTGFPGSIILVNRLQVLREDLKPNGVFTGVGFGAYTNNHLYIAGALLVNDVEHFGVLTKPAYPESLDSWQIAFQADIEILNATTFRCLSQQVPSELDVRLALNQPVRFQIFSGSQQGVYDVVEIVRQSDDTSTITVSNSFPEDPELWENRDFRGSFESPWSQDFVTYRLVINDDIKTEPKGKATLYIGGFLNGQALTLTGAPPFAIPPDGVLLYPTGQGGKVFWGSLDREAANRSRWTFVRYALDPDRERSLFDGIVVAADMSVLPEDGPTNIWFRTEDFGQAELDASSQLLLRATSSSSETEAESYDLTFGYGRVEPFLQRKVLVDVDAKFHVDSGILGAGDAQIRLTDANREARLSTILYDESGPERTLITLSSVSLTGFLDPETQGWSKLGEGVLRVLGKRLRFRQEGDALVYEKDLPTPGNGGRILDLVVQVKSGDFYAECGSGIGRVVGLDLRGDDIVLVSGATDVAIFPVPWDNGDSHTYRLIIDDVLDVVTLVFDDQVVGTAPWSLFALGSSTLVSFGQRGVGDGEAIVFSFSVTETPSSSAQRTLGVWLGGDVNDINSWEIPRVDSSTVPNSDLSANVVPMDWTQTIQVRVRRDPSWGITVYRPDLPPPPYFTGDFATKTVDPSGGWINVEYRNLPLLTGEGFGTVQFGALDPRSISQQRWEDVRYRVYLYRDKSLRSPHHMVYNQYNVIHSGEVNRDISLETSTVMSKDSQTLSLTSLGVTVDRVFNLIFINSAGKQVVYNPGSFVFDKETQTIRLTTEITFAYYPSQDVPDEEDPNVINPSLNDTEDPNFVYPSQDPQVLLDRDFEPRDQGGFPLNTKVPVIVNYAAGKPVTIRYVCERLLNESAELLFSGTPSFAKTLALDPIERVLEPGGIETDPNGTDTIENSPYLSVEFTEAFKGLYDRVKFCEKSDGEDCLTSPICDAILTPVPGTIFAGDPNDLVIVSPL